MCHLSSTNVDSPGFVDDWTAGQDGDDVKSLMAERHHQAVRARRSVVPGAEQTVHPITESWGSVQLEHQLAGQVANCH